MQTSLFDDQNVLKITYQNCLKEFKMREALDTLEKWHVTSAGCPKIEGKIHALSGLLKLSEQYRRHSLIFLANIKVNLNEQNFLMPLFEDKPLLERGISKGIYSRLQNDAYDFIVPGLHPAEIFIEFNAYENALNSAKRYLAKMGEHPFIRQLEGYAYFKMGDEKSARICFTYALFNDPLMCTGNYMYPGDYKNKIDYLTQTMKREELAWIRLPFDLWLEGKTYIVSDAYHYEAYLKEKLRAERSSALLEPMSNVRYFCRLLYLAEAVRLRAGRKNETDELTDIRKEMQRINPDLFTRYMGVLNSFGN